ncbi:HisA/HisF-related TIM barrel protein [Neptunicoccus cionae]|uniref:1-(5-phosphoribosyl)-5-[(5- phosphoribosylamino)methylideneamino]imidazole-4- carboxamide isomerase n=1 Tax=Neptunicoccus cionae TaxID=2035344 RepID=UPI000C789CE0|nr:1-(5-phosphoribosyl)-5-[(5-phosphoribosylamino)methylideneamino] imidazole-4-carboxamide isomerase [Amylibacter cionae]PLS22209.1 1-(5-phosphoribosyl)-5-((5-phosphoribosylamino)methylideneamino)imidazole-4-carboxamide isomerase [Amylibacter cionae]
MIIYPTIELKDGKCVSLTRGRLEEAAVWHVDPLSVAKSFAEAGASWMQVTDFNAIEGGSENVELVEEIIRTVGIPVQVAGGMRSVESAVRWIDKGAGRIVIGTAAVKQPALVQQLARAFPDQIIVAVDCWRGRVLTDGWREESMFAPIPFLRSYSDAPLAGFLVTDVDADVEDIEVGASEISVLAASTRHPVIASGLVRTLDDVSMLKYAGHCDGVIIGRALFNKTVDLRKALEIAVPEVEEIASFV